MDSTVRFQEQAGFVHFSAMSNHDDCVELHYYQAGVSESNIATIIITTTSKDRRLKLLKQMEEEIKRCIEECKE